MEERPNMNWRVYMSNSHLLSSLGLFFPNLKIKQLVRRTIRYGILVQIQIAAVQSVNSCISKIYPMTVFR